MKREWGRSVRLGVWVSTILAAVLIAWVLVMPGAAQGRPSNGEPADIPRPSIFFFRDVSKRLDKAKADNRGVLPLGRVVLTGSSTIAGWKTSANDLVDWPTVNVGISGTTIMQHAGSTQELIEPLRPGALIVYVGVNDLSAPRRPAAFDPQRGQGAQLVKTAESYFTRLGKAAPGAHIYYISMIESPRKRPVLNDLRRANAGIRALAEADPDVSFIEVNSALSGPDGLPEAKYFADGLHLNEDGYKILTEQVRAALWERPAV